MGPQSVEYSLSLLASSQIGVWMVPGFRERTFYIMNRIYVKICIRDLRSIYRNNFEVHLGMKSESFVVTLVNFLIFSPSRGS